MYLAYLKPRAVVCLCALFFAWLAQAQVVDRKPQTDTLSVADRLSVRTNAADWLLLLPNIGVELDLGNKNWSRWALGLDVRGNWQTSHTYKPGIVYNLAEASAELRYYWRPRQIDGRGVRLHKRLLGRLFSCRRNKVRRPEVVYYRGVYVSYSDFSFKFGPEGHQGSAIGAGVSWGAVRPLYVFANGHSLDLELGLRVGAAYARTDTYRHDRVDNCYPVTERGRWKIVPFPVVNTVRVGLVYRLGTYPSTSKYRWRYDCDYTFAALQDSINSARETARINELTADSIRGLIDKEFWRVYKTAADSNKIVADSLKRVADRLRREAKRAERERRDSLKQAARAARDSVKAAADSAKTAMTDSIAAVADSITAAADTAKTAVTDSIAAVADSITAAADSAKTAVTDSIAAAADSITAAADTAKTAMTDSIAAVADSITAAADTAKTAVTDSIAAVADSKTAAADTAKTAMTDSIAAASNPAAATDTATAAAPQDTTTAAAAEPKPDAGEAEAGGADKTPAPADTGSANSDGTPAAATEERKEDGNETA